MTRIKGRPDRTKLQSLTPRRIATFYATLVSSGGFSEKGLATKTVRNTHVVLRKALGDAERLGLIGRSAAAAARPPTARRPDRQMWSSEELTEFLIGLRGERLHALPALGAHEPVTTATLPSRRNEIDAGRSREFSHRRRR